MDQERDEMAIPVFPLITSEASGTRAELSKANLHKADLSGTILDGA